MSADVQREDFAKPGHFCAADRCRFVRHSHVGPYCVSTVGDWWPKGETQAEQIGHGRYFETMVFRVGEDGEVADYGNHVDFRGYTHEADAALGHERIVEEWERIARAEAARPGQTERARDELERIRRELDAHEAELAEAQAMVARIRESRGEP